MLEVDSRLIRIEQRLRLAYAAISVLILAVVCLSIGEVWAFHHPAYPEVMTLRRLNIVDQKGVARVIIAAPAPDPVVGGTQHHRDGTVSGVIIADATGTERGGYVTADGYANALLTLDAPGKQTVLLLAEPTGHTLLRLWGREAQNVPGSITMGVWGAPFLNEKQGGRLVFSAPAKNPQSQDPRNLFR
jgi:hypothetical protein